MGNQQPSLVEKMCRVCEEVRSLANFKRYDCRGKTLHKNICIACEKEWHKNHIQNHPKRAELLAAQRLRQREWRKKDPAKTKARAKHFHALYRDRDRELIYQRYGGKCKCCGETQIRFLTVDHVDSDGHIERKQGFYTSGSQFYRYVIQQDFPDTYQLLCYNCNLGRARNDGICPHQKGSTTISQESTAKRPEVHRVQ